MGHSNYDIAAVLLKRVYEQDLISEAVYRSTLRKLGEKNSSISTSLSSHPGEK